MAPTPGTDPCTDPGTDPRGAVGRIHKHGRFPGTGPFVSLLNHTLAWVTAPAYRP